MVTEVDICGLKFRNPVIPASGTFGFALEMDGSFDLNLLGGISLKGTTLHPRFGNECPRIAECPAGLINSVGLQNPGIEELVSSKVPALRRIYGGVIIANISGFSIDDYVESCARAAECGDIDMIEVNVSCPNVHGGGMAFGTSASSAAEVTREVKKVTGNKPVSIKLSPNVTDITEIALSCENAGADALTLINTVLGMRVDIHRRRSAVAAGYGGYSGPGVFPIALRMVHQVSGVCSIPVIGCGGVSSASDVIEMMMAGASAVQIGSANLRNPMICKEIVEALPSIMEELSLESLKGMRI